ncbi:MAG: hypothetical protein ACHQVK_00155, partial [Candidatus Paceibacterales bacterium]
LEEASRRLNAVGPKPPHNGPEFYQGLSRLIPNAFTPDDLEWLIENDGNGDGGFEILFNLEFYRPSSLVAEFMNKIHANK